MPADSSQLRNRLLSNDQEFRELAAQHHDLDERLHSLSSKPYLSNSEQVEETQIKKRKLHLKDRMEDILRRHRTASL
ncbi:MAG: YdcH family protein [Vicinamibacterales bacterium]